ncbi:uncharacterized protein LOC109419272 [Aedes albopictus]|uniref:AIG1-type G domain-containing protein n=1 Tax=Aedes albopictus TaxID=7160 RepID=A0ABM1Z8R2_AEDAL
MSHRSTSKQIPRIENRSSKNVYNVLLVGETGSGKSTLINYLTNFFRGGTLQSLKIAIPSPHYRATEGFAHHENDLDDAMKSKTGKCTFYNFSLNGTHYAFIDTPGLSDTSGRNKDAENILKIMDVAEMSGTIAAVMLVINGTVSRRTATLTSTINMMKSSVPDVLLKNLVVVLTNCSATSANFDVGALSPWIIAEKNKFYMNNSALSKPMTFWMDDEEKFDEIERDWKKSMRTLDKMVKQITQLGHVTSNAFGEMRTKKSEIKAELNAHMSDMKKLNALRNKLTDLQHAENVAANAVSSYSNYRKNTEVEYVENKPTPYYNVICRIHGTVCCLNCERNGFWPMTFCSYFVGLSPCRNCGCGIGDHFDAQYEPVKKTKTVETILEETKQLYDQSTHQRAMIRGQLCNLSGDLDFLEKEVDAKIQKIIDNCRALQKICSQFNFSDELASTIAALKADAGSLTNLEVKADALAKIARIQSFTTSLSTKPGGKW